MTRQRPSAPSKVATGERSRISILAPCGKSVCTWASSTHGIASRSRSAASGVGAQHGRAVEVVDDGGEAFLVGVHRPLDLDVVDGEQRRTEHCQGGDHDEHQAQRRQRPTAAACARRLAGRRCAGRGSRGSICGAPVATSRAIVSPVRRSSMKIVPSGTARRGRVGRLAGAVDDDRRWGASGTVVSASTLTLTLNFNVEAQLQVQRRVRAVPGRRGSPGRPAPGGSGSAASAENARSNSSRTSAEGSRSVPLASRVVPEPDEADLAAQAHARSPRRHAPARPRSPRARRPPSPRRRPG